MALYLGNNRVKINIDGVKYSTNSPIVGITFEGVRLLTSDDYILTDSSYTYICAKEDE